MPSKRELDKEKMFHKIMPSSAQAGKAAGETEPAEQGAPTQAAPVSAPPEAPKAASGGGGKLSDDAIAALFAQQGNEVPAPVPQTALPPTPGDGGKLSDDAIAALFAQQDDEVPEFAPQPAPQPASGNGKLSDDAIAALFAQQDDKIEPEPQPTPEAPSAEEPEPAKNPALDVAALYTEQHAKTLAENAEYEDTIVQQPTDELHSQPEVAAPAPVQQPVTSAPAPQAPPAPAAQPTVPVANTPQPQPPAAAPEEAPHPVNLAEVFVDQCYERYRQRLNGCHCEKCRDDVLGMALNRIKPHYITSDQMDPELLADRTMAAECVTALIRALFVVKRNPKHNLAEAKR